MIKGHVKILILAKIYNIWIYNMIYLLYYNLYTTYLCHKNYYIFHSYFTSHKTLCRLQMKYIIYSLTYHIDYQELWTIIYGSLVGTFEWTSEILELFNLNVNIRKDVIYFNFTPILKSQFFVLFQGLIKGRFLSNFWTFWIQNFGF